jgi:diamine N-acetyltransferase
MKNLDLALGKIRFRALEPEDIDLLMDWENDLEIWELSNTYEPFSRYVLSKFIKESQRDIFETKQIRLIIETKQGKAVGAIDLFNFDPFHQRAGVGILVHDLKSRRNGFATDALQLLCNYANNYLGLHQLFANISEDNLGSILLFQKAGFHLCGTKQQWRKTSSGWKNELMFQKLF